MKNRILTLAIATLLALNVQAQLRGIVLDDQTGDTIGFAGILYKGHNLGVAADGKSPVHVPRYFPIKTMTS